ncbi:MAG: sn-glycerol-3-phosphate ABC transporter ATP-binding protein UgpC [Acidobacteriota bacterium]
MANVTFDHVRKTYDPDVTVIRDFSLEIRDQEFMVLVGPSGCGKSTALRMIAGLEEISDGTISIGGRVVNDLPPKDRDIAMVFQSYALYPHMTVRENLSFGLRIRKMPKHEIDERVNEAAEILGLTGLLDRKPRAMSGGQRQRVAVGRAIVRKPQVFLFDEPLSNLDAKLRVQMRAEISKLQRRLETTTVYVTHDQVEAMTMGHRIAIMKDGDLQQVGSPLEVYATPHNVFVATFIGTPPMNFFRGRLTTGVEAAETSFGLLPIAESLRPGASGKGGDEVLIGIRPEHLVDARQPTRGETFEVDAQVEVVEPLGHEALVHCRVGDELLVAKVQPYHTPDVGTTMRAALDLDQVHVFDAETELRLDAPDPSPTR